MNQPEDVNKDYFECMTEANDNLGEAWSQFEKANPDKTCVECMNCGQWFALRMVTEDDSCSRCGALFGDD